MTEHFFNDRSKKIYIYIIEPWKPLYILLTSYANSGSPHFRKVQLFSVWIVMTFQTVHYQYSVMQSDRNTFYGNASSQNMKFMSSSELIFCGNPCLSVVHDFVVWYNQLFYVAINTKNKWRSSIRRTGKLIVMQSDRNSDQELPLFVSLQQMNNMFRHVRKMIT